MSNFPAESVFKKSLRGLRAPLPRARPHFSTLAFSAKGRKLSPATLILQAALWGRHGTRYCDRRTGRRWRDDPGKSEDPFLPLRARALLCPRFAPVFWALTWAVVVAAAMRSHCHPEPSERVGTAAPGCPGEPTSPGSRAVSALLYPACVETVSAGRIPWLQQSRIRSGSSILSLNSVAGFQPAGQLLSEVEGGRLSRRVHDSVTPA